MQLLRKRDGSKQHYSTTKIEHFLTELTKTRPFLREIAVKSVSSRIRDSLSSGMSTQDLAIYIAEVCAALTVNHWQYSHLGGRILVSMLHRSTPNTFVECMKTLESLMSPVFVETCEKHAEQLNAMIVHERDYQYDMMGYKTLERSYLLRKEGIIVERPQYMLMRVAVALHGEDLEAVRQTYEATSRQQYTHATPTLFHAGLAKQQLASCFLMTMVDDSIEGIFETLKRCALISKGAGGIGLSVANVRGGGSAINGTNGVSNGLAPMLRVFNDTARYVDQGGGKRKGSFAIFLEPHHPDILDFLELKKNHGVDAEKARDLFYGLWISDLFMERVKNNQPWSVICPTQCPSLQDAIGDNYKALYEACEMEGKVIKTFDTAREVWFAILDAQIETGTPYMMYKDHCNRKSNQQNLGTIRGSNLCVAPETRILTSIGWKQISTLQNKDVTVWNGQEWSETRVMQTGQDQPLMTVRLSNGSVLHCTEYHKFYIQKSYHARQPTCVRAHELKAGMKLIKCDYPVIDSGTIWPYAYTHGLFCADGTYTDTEELPRRCTFKSKHGGHCNRHQEYPSIYAVDDGYCMAETHGKKPSITLYGEKRMLLPHLDYRTSGADTGNINVQLQLDLPEKFAVPLEANLDSKLRWLEGYLDGDGCVVRNGQCQTIQAGSIHGKFLHDILLMLQTLGVHATVRPGHPAELRRLPDGRGGHRNYRCKAMSRLQIASKGCQQLLLLGFSPKRLIIERRQSQRSALKFVKVVSAELSQRRDDTYCFTEMKRGMGMFEGVLTGQCCEIVEYTSPEETAVCTLASIALPSFCTPNQFDFGQLERVVRLATRNLNKTIDVNWYPIEQARVSNLKHRPIGIGVQGLADVFQMLNMPYDSEAARQLNKDIFETIYFSALSESIQLAKTSGPYSSFKGSPFSQGKTQIELWGHQTNDSRHPWTQLKKDLQKYGCQNSLLTAPMPTASTASILGNTESFEPRTSNLYTRRVLSGEYIVINKYLQSALKARGLWSEDMGRKLIAHRGSVQNIPEVPDDIKKVFRTVWEISQRSIIDMAADRGPYIDQSQSLNIHVEEPTRAILTSIHFHTWSKGLKTGQYYLRSQPKAKALQFTVAVKEEDDCVMCSA